MTRSSHAVFIATYLASACGDDSATSEAGTTSSTETGATTSATQTTTAETGATTSATATTTAETAASESDSTTGAPLCGAGFQVDGARVPTSFGPIEGEQIGDSEIFRFRGVPFAAPPTGELRLRPPEAPECWSEVRPTRDPAPACLQLVDAEGSATVGDEDCLYLNLWTPATGPGDRPVLVFIHGGGNAAGSAGDPLYDGRALAESQGVVVITVAYRLGALGYLTHPALAAESATSSSGNYGALDQLHALRWVRDNVASFGGDPSKILLFGESAGAVNACTLLGSPLAAGLFNAAIVQSGACSERSLAVYTQQISGPWISASGCADQADVPACLRALPATELVKIAPNGFPNVAAIAQGFGPHVDGYVVPEPALQAFAAGRHNRVPVIVGANAEETALAVPPLTLAQYNALVQSTFALLGAAAIDQILALYDPADYGGPQAAYVALTGDVKFVCNARRAARALAAGQKEPIYRYHFAYNGYTSGPNNPPRAFHGLELVYIFGNFSSIELGGFEYKPNADDLAMSALLGGAWARLADAGDPSGGGLTWPLYQVNSDPYALLDAPPSAGEGVRTAECDLWDQLLGF
jgi:para-nitrobenzyl esterase